MNESPLLDIPAMQASAEQACALLKALANPDRLLLLCQLAQGERCVGELEQLTGIRQPTLSQQLGVLRNGGLARTRREGKNIYYAIDNAAALEVMQALYRNFCQ